MKIIKKTLFPLSAFLMAVSIAAIFSAVAQAQTVTLDGVPKGSLEAAVADANTAGGGLIELSAGTFEIKKALRIERNINIVGAVNADGTPASTVTYDDNQPFTLNTTSTKYLITVGNYNPGQVHVVADFTNIEVIAGTPTHGCPGVGGGAPGACELGAFNYIVSNAAGSVTGTLTNTVAVGGTVGLVINNNKKGACEVTTDGFAVAEHSWGGVNVSQDAFLILGPHGITTPPGYDPDAFPVYGDAETAQVIMPDGTTQSLAPGETLYIFSFDPNGGNIDGSTAVKQQNVHSGSPVTAPMATRIGHEFIGWYTDVQGTTEWDDAALPTGNTMVYAIWAADAKLEPVSVPTVGGGVLAALSILLAGLAVVMLRRNRFQ